MKEVCVETLLTETSETEEVKQERLHFEARDLEGPSQRAITRYSYHTEIQTHVFIIKI